MPRWRASSARASRRSAIRPLIGELKDALVRNAESRSAAGESGLIEAAQRPAEWVIGAITGAAGLKPTLAAAERGAIVALANKETLVCAGALFMRRAAAAGATVLPVNSEHNALFQAMSGGRRQDVRRVILTASGGPFRTASAADGQERDSRAGTASIPTGRWERRSRSTPRP